MKNLLAAIGEPAIRACATSLNHLNAWVQAQVGKPAVVPDGGSKADPQHSEEQNRALLSAIPDILTVVNAEGIYQSISYNQFSGEAIPLDNMDVTGMHISEVLPPKAAAQKLAAVQQALATGKLQLYEQEIPFGDRIQYEEVRVVPYRHDQAMCIVRDISDRKQVELTLRETEERYSRATHAAKVGVWEWNLKTQEIYIDPSIKAWVGCTDLEFPNDIDYWLMFAHPSDRDMIITRVQDYLDGKTQEWIFEHRMVHQDGSIIWVLVQGQLLRDEHGNPERLIGTDTDITNRKQIELALRESEALQKAIIQAIPDLLIRMNRDGTYNDIISSPYVHALCKETSIQGVTVQDVLPDEVAEQRLHHAQLAVDTGNLQIYEQTLEIDGELCYEEVRIVPMPDQTVLTIIRDISDRKRAEIALKLSQERLQTLVNALPFGVWVRDADDRVVLQNSIDVARYGNLLGRSLDTFPTLQGCEAQYFQIKEHYKIGEFFTYESIEALDGEDRYFLRITATLPDADGRKGMFGVAIDITDRKQTELAIQQLNEKLEQRIEQRTQALAQSEQDLRTIFNNVYDAILIHNMDGSIADANDRALELYGATREQLLGAMVPDLSAPDADLEQLPNILQRVKAGETMQIEWRERRFSDRSTFDAEVSLRQVMLGNRPVFIAGVRDISDRKQAERALRESQQFIQTVLDTVPMPMFWKDRDSIFLGCNQQLAKIMELESTSDLIGKTGFEFSPTEAEATHYLADDRQVMESGIAKLGIEETFTLPNGEQRWIETHKAPLRDWTGNVVGLVGMFQDITERKQTEEAIRDSEERLRLALTAANQGLYDLNIQTGETIVSSEYVTMLGYDPATFRETNAYWIERLHPDDRNPVANVYRAYIAGEISDYKVEFRQRTSDGQWKWILSLGKIVAWDDTGHPLRMLGTHTDIDERKRAEAQLQEQEQFLRSIYEGVSQPIFVTDVLPDNTIRIVGWNPTTARLVGKSSEEVAGKPIADAFNERNTEEILERHAQCIAAMHPLIFEEQIILKGSPRWTVSTYSPLINQDGRVYRIVGTGYDITDRKQAEIALQEAQQFAQSIAENTPNIIYIYDLIGQRNLYTNQEVSTLLGYTSDEIQTREVDFLLSVIHPDDWPIIQQFQTDIAKANDNDIFELEYRVQHRNGEWRWLYDRITVFKRDETGRVIHYIGSAQDITERKKLEQELRQINAELENRVEERTTDLRQAVEAAEAANRAKSTFLANMSHELRTPLNAILGFAQLMSRDRTLDAEKHQQLSIINRSGEHLLHLINDILEMSKIEAGRSSFTPTCLDLLTLLDTMEELFQLRALEKGLQFTIERAPNLHPYIETDENKLRQVLINLLGNAIKFTQRGYVVLRVQICYGATSSDSISLRTATLHVEVEDTGLGIDPTELESLFEPFTQSKNRQPIQEGTGLGLPISRQFVQLMGGDLIVQSTPGLGSVFAFSIPVQLTEATALSHTIPSRHIIGLAPNQTPPRVLVVEDNDTNRQLLVQLLQTIGFELRSATQGQEAIALWESWQPQLIWMDMRMPTLDGYEATRQIRHRERQNPTLPPTIILALTANAFEEDRARALEVGCNDFVRKPFQTAELLEKIASHLGVEYVYAEERQAEAKMIASSSLSFDAIAALRTCPASWLTQVHQATLQLDGGRLTTLFEHVREAQPQLTNLLQSNLDNFDFELILELVQAAMETPSEAPTSNQQ